MVKYKMAETCMTYTQYKYVNKLKQNNLTKQFNILIVDDDKIIAETFGDILKGRGHTVTISNDIISCINKCQNNHYDIIFMDFNLNDPSNMNGVDTTDLLKNVCKNNPYLFAITGNDSNEVILKFRNIGMDGVLIKPLDIDIINKLMNSLEIRNDIDKRVIKNLKFKRQLFIFD